MYSFFYAQNPSSKCERVAKNKIAKITHSIDNTIYTILIHTMEEKKKLHRYKRETQLTLQCYSCGNEWKLKGVLHFYTCPICGTKAEGHTSV